MANGFWSERAAKVAIYEALAAAESGCVAGHLTIAKMRLALSLLRDGEPSTAELEPVLGRDWRIVMRRSRPGDLTPKQFRLAQIRALARRVRCSDEFVRAQLEG